MPQLPIDSAPPAVHLAVRGGRQRVSPPTREPRDLAALRERHRRRRAAVLVVAQPKLPKLHKRAHQRPRLAPQVSGRRPAAEALRLRHDRGPLFVPSHLPIPDWTLLQLRLHTESYLCPHRHTRPPAPRKPCPTPTIRPSIRFCMSHGLTHEI
eukprot:135454-Chlamydomonas_euryale.AAC.1